MQFQFPYEIYKIYNYSSVTNIQSIVVFTGPIKSFELLADLYKQKPNDNVFDAIFENKDDRPPSSKVLFSNLAIYRDDTIYAVHTKYIQALSSRQNIRLEEIYMFYTTDEPITPELIFANRLSKTTTLTMTSKYLHKLMRNVVHGYNYNSTDYDGDTNSTLTYTDIMDMFKKKNIHGINRQLNIDEKISRAVVNPFALTNGDSTDARTSIGPSMNNLLFEFDHMSKNTLSTCFVDDIISETSGIPNTFTHQFLIKTYFHHLFYNGVYDTHTLLKFKTTNKPQNILANQSKNIVDILWGVSVSDVSHTTESISASIHGFHISIQASDTLPLDILFKFMSTTKDWPMIKYYKYRPRHSHADKIYRLFANKTNSDGRKIPLLDKLEIHRFDRIMAKNISLSMMHVINKGSITYNIIYELFQTGKIDVFWYHTENDYTPIVGMGMTGVSTSIDNLIKPGLDYIYSTVGSFLKTHGYNMNPYTSILDTDVVTIKNISYTITYGGNNGYSLSHIKNCISKLFVIDDNKTSSTSKISTQINGRFRRVANFSEKNSLEAFINRIIVAGIDDRETTIKKVMDAFELTMPDASDKIEQFIDGLTTTDNAVRKKVGGFINTGFPTIFEINIRAKKLTVAVSDINNIHYIDTLHTYIDSIAKIIKKNSSISNILSSCISYEPDVPAPIHVSNINRQQELNEGESEGEEEELEYRPDNQRHDAGLFDFLDSDKEGDGDDDGDDDDDDDDIFSGGGGGHEYRDPVGLRLKHINLFQSKIKDKVPGFFKVSKDKGFTSYSKMCQPTNTHVPIPVILTDEEKQTMIDEHPDTVNEESDFIKYKYKHADPNEKNKSYHYTCPQYWCLATDKMVTKEDIENGLCGGEIDPTTNKIKESIDDLSVKRSDAKVPAGKTVYRFYDDNGKRYPGFNLGNTEDGNCVPCCYKTWGDNQHRRGECKTNNDGNDDVTDDAVDTVIPKKKPGAVIQDENQYVTGPEKIPDIGRWGFLPEIVQEFFHDVHKLDAHTIINSSNSNLFVRQGVEQHPTQSFIACIANSAFYLLDTKSPIPTISTMKQILRESVDIDLFVSLQNGTMIDAFAKKRTSGASNEAYTSSKIYAAASPSKKIFTRIAGAYENFIRFMSDENTIIDHTWLWDLVCIPNKNVFPLGINLIILEIVNNDIHIVCPTNIHSSTKMDPSKKYLFILKQNNYYTPIYHFNKKKNNTTITKFFILDKKSKTKHDAVNNILSTIISPIYDTQCSVGNTNTAYHVHTRISATKKFIIEFQVFDSRGKVIGLYGLDIITSKKGMIPCYPSSPIPNVPYIFLHTPKATEIGIWKPFSNTIDLLTKYCSKINGKCELTKVVHDDVVVGLLTHDHLYVQVSDSVSVDSTKDDKLPIIISPSFSDADAYIFRKKGEDSERATHVQNTSIETVMYKNFRNVLKTYIDDYDNIKKRVKLNDACMQKYKLYSKQLENVSERIHKMIDSQVQFVEFDTESDIRELAISSMISNVGNMTIDEDGAVILPATNLITGEDNSVVYFTKLADELLRYEPIRNFMFSLDKHIPVGNIKYNIHNDEIVTFSHVLNNPLFFKNLDNPIEMGNYESNIPFDVAQPMGIKLPIETFNINASELNKQTNDDVGVEQNLSQTVCAPHKSRTIMSPHWRNIFGMGFFETMYFGTNTCGHFFIKDIVRRYGVKDNNNTAITIGDISKTLYNSYSKMTNSFGDLKKNAQLVRVLESYGHKNIKLPEYKGDNGIVDLQLYLLSDKYILNMIDMWVLMVAFEIQAIFISGLPHQTEIVTYMNPPENKLDKWVFIFYPTADNTTKQLRYRYVETGKNEIQITPTDKLANKIKKGIDTYNSNTLSTFISNHKK